ncbi:acyltransferase [Halopiger aswanensis]|uniref:Transferase family hexapeptide repeat protein n=1 Tax=Halopiger aswanensis TaxID=148449 RepID=A0A3R7DCK2_9EURY|nr:acyltransferase [Halopiger aswanensis]RKD94762.1 transferase family hexapeptide repeat protein [Halopiger aswanensis]
MTDDSPGTESESESESGSGSRTRHDRITRHPTAGPRNSLAFWTDAKHPLRIAINYVVVWLVRISPSLRLKRWLMRRIGVTVGDDVSWGLEATPDVFWPELITLEDHAIVGYDATLLCHEFLQDEYRTGEVVVGERAMIGAGAIVLPGVEIGAEARVAANSLVTRDVEPGTTVAGVPARPMGGDSDDDTGATADEADENESGER